MPFDNMSVRKDGIRKFAFSATVSYMQAVLVLLIILPFVCPGPVMYFNDTVYDFGLMHAAATHS
jgi:hypothetical protein